MSGNRNERRKMAATARKRGVPPVPPGVAEDGSNGTNSQSNLSRSWWNTRRRPNTRAANCDCITIRPPTVTGMNGLIDHRPARRCRYAMENGK